MFRILFLGVAVIPLCCADAIETNEIFDYWPKSKADFSPDFGEALFLTPYIRSGKVDEAKNLSVVGSIPNTPELLSYSGFFTVNEKYDSNIFFWFFPAINADPTAPLVLWLQGGPGMSGLFGLFVEHGPYGIASNLTASMKQYHWPKSMHVIYVDNPVGTGFSFTRNDSAYPTNQEMVSNDLYEFLQQFFTVYPEYRKNDFYVAGEYYGGKFATSLAYKIHTEGSSSKINLKGIAIGNGFIDPESMLDYSPYLYQLGLVDRKEAAFLQNVSNTVREYLNREEYYEALLEVNKLIIPFKVLPYDSYFSNYTGYQFFYNFFYTREPRDFNYYRSFIELPQIRKAIHVGNLTFQDGKKAQKPLLPDIMRSVRDEITVLMDNYKVLFYNGQMDLIVPYPLTVNFLHSVKWKNSEAYKNAERKIWRLHGTGGIVGYVHQVGDFYEVLVRDSGQIVAYDQPELSLDLMVQFTFDLPFP